MVRLVRQLAALALAQPQLILAAYTLRGVPDLVELEAVDGGVFASRQGLAAYGGENDVDCEQEWQAEECDGKTLTQKFVFKITTPPAGGGRACEPEATEVRRCQPIHCQMGPWSDWSACDENGLKKRTRDTDVTPLYGGRECPHSEDVVKCRKQDCRVCEWSAWVCDPYTERKKRTRHVTRQPELDGAPCPTELEQEDKCDPVDCEYLEYEFTPWSACDKPTGERRRSHIVTQEPLYGGAACPADEVEPCDVDCEYEDKAQNNDEFYPCAPDDPETKTVWHRVKIYDVKIQKRNNGKECDPAKKEIRELCEPVACTYKSVDDSEGSYGTCEEDPVSHTFIQKKKIDVDQPALYGGACPDKYDAKECPPVPCTYKSADESEGTYGQCVQDEARNAYFQTKKLDINEPALYGGACPDKYAEKECPPVPCTYKSATASAGDYGECKEDRDRNAFFQTKKLEIDQPALYGGECPDQYDEKECPPVHCKWADEQSTDELVEDCTYYASENVWKKTKQRQVETPAQYGGRPCEGDGKYVEVCPPQQCVLGPFGTWTECNVDGEKEQFRALLHAALYGGSCDPQTETGKCTGQDCQLAADDADDDWSECKADGFKYKTLRITQYPRFGGSACPVREVSKPCAKVDCIVSDWAPWGACEDGRRKRKRSVVQEATFGGQACPALEETEDCVQVPCVLDSWSAWGPCGADNKRSRVREVLVPSKNVGGACEREVQTQECPRVDCVVGDWGKWGKCAKNRSTNKKVQTREREVLQLPQNGGAACPALSETQGCEDNDCRVGDWGDWGACVRSNGKRTRKRTRTCHKCDASVKNEETADCDVGCTLSAWSDPTVCSDAQSKITSVRSVLIPAEGAGTCSSELKTEESCAPIDCVLDDWSPWSECDGSGTRTRTRGELQAPKHGGKPCAAEHHASRYQQEQCASADCYVSEWGAWSECAESASSAPPTQTRTRTTAGPVGSGRACPPASELTETRECAKVDCVLTDWGRWGPCVDGVKSRERAVEVEPKFGGKACEGKMEETQDCVVTDVLLPSVA